MKLTAVSSSSMRHLIGGLGLAGVALTLAACTADVASSSNEAVSSTQERWDSQAGNPTHATHSYLTEFAVDQLSPYYPELATYKSTIVDGANQELHELPLSNPELEALREEAEGTNWACNHPERIWQHALDSYAAGDKNKAYWYTGIVLHWVEDMGVPAHAFHVIHQGTLTQADNFELLGLQRWAPLYDMTREWPGLAAPSDYVVWNGGWTSDDFHATFPGVTYTRGFFSVSWLWASNKQATFVREREGRSAVAAEWALYAAVNSL
jgi:hypothetical protein